MLWRAILVFLLLSWSYLAWRNFAYEMRLRFAAEQIRTIIDLKTTAIQSSTPDKYLQALRNYYPSGTKQVEGSKLDFIVETVRTNAIHEIMTARARTSNDASRARSGD